MDFYPNFNNVYIKKKKVEQRQLQFRGNKSKLRKMKCVGAN